MGMEAPPNRRNYLVSDWAFQERKQLPWLDGGNHFYLPPGTKQKGGCADQTLLLGFPFSVFNLVKLL